MRNFKKTILSFLVFVFVFMSISSVVIFPYYNSECKYYLDQKCREQLSGTIDSIFIGASHGLTSFEPQIIDKKLNWNSYNLSCSMMTLPGKYVLLKKELERNPVKEVVLELSYDTLSRNQDSEYAIGDEPLIARLDSNLERVKYLVKNVTFDDFLNIYSQSFVNGLAYWKDSIIGSETKGFDYDDKGFHSKKVNDVSLSDSQVVSKYNKKRLPDSFLKENISQFKEIIDLCKNHNVRIIVAVCPISDKLIWQNDNWDYFFNWSSDFCLENDIEFYDFNIIHSRYSLFSDKKSFADDDHMSNIGADALSNLFSDIIVRVNKGEDVSDLFYSSYEEMKADSPYMKYYNSNK